MSTPPEEPYRGGASWVLVYRRGLVDALALAALAGFLFLVSSGMLIGGIVFFVDAVRPRAVGRGLFGLGLIAAAVVLFRDCVRHVRDRLRNDRQVIDGVIEGKRVGGGRHPFYVVRVDGVEYDLPRRGWKRLAPGMRTKIAFVPGRTIVEASVLRDEATR